MINGANLLSDTELLGVGREGCRDRGHGWKQNMKDLEIWHTPIVSSVARVFGEGPRPGDTGVIQSEEHAASALQKSIAARGHAGQALCAGSLRPE